jgi:DNA-binding NtrC family response regulator
VARALHRHSARAQQPFVAINTAAMPKDLLESELFGHERGSFTGAQQQRRGRFEQAEGGTLFLDEIGDMPMEAQTRLLRVLQQGEYTTVGGRTPIKTDVRIVAATNKDLRLLIAQGLFREDLYFRLNVVPLRLPPLRERSEDIQLLTEHFLHMYAHKYERAIEGVSQAAYQRLFSHSWPGNVRELQNVLERAVLLAKNNRIEPVDLPFDNGTLPEAGSASPGWDVPPNMTLEDIERLVIEKTLQRTGGNKQAAANLLGIYRPRLYSKIRKYNIDVPGIVSA